MTSLRRKYGGAVSIGETMTEVLHRVTELPEKNSTVVVPDSTRALGGAALNVAWGLASLGRLTRLVTSVAAQDFAQLRRMTSGLPINLAAVARTRAHSDLLAALLTQSAHQ